MIRLIVLYNHEKIGAILRTLGENTKSLKKGQSIPYNPALIFFQKSNIAQTMRLIVFYNHAKI